MKKRKKKGVWYKMCSNCKGKIKYTDEHGFPVYYINEKPLNPLEFILMEEAGEKITVFCGPECSLEYHEELKD